MYKILTADGDTRCEVSKIEYSGTMNGTRQVTCTIESPVPVEWALDGSDYLEYRGEQYLIRYAPSAKKQARTGTTGEAYVYELTLNSVGDELATCDFLDVVAEDNNIHYTALPNFSFYCDKVETFAERLQANLDRLYTGENKWSVVVAEGLEITPKSMSFSTVKCTGALSQLYTDFKIAHTIRGRVITLGGESVLVPYTFRYGKEKGLKSVESEISNNQAIVTRVRVYGSTKNLPYRYYNKLTDSFGNPVVSESMYVPNLMLPMFRENGKDAYIEDADAIAKYGVREGTVFFDGSNENEEVCPTMEGMTATDLAEAGYTLDITDGDNGNLDEVAWAETMSDSGVMPESGELDEDASYFNIGLKDIGFDINDYLTSDTASITLNSGACAGRTFEIIKCEKGSVGLGRYVVTLKKVIDEGIQMYFPNKSYQVSSGDKFVLVNITMPDVYIETAEVRLKAKGTEWLAKNCKAQPTFSPDIDEIEVFRNPDVAQSLIEGNTLVLEDADLGIQESINISTLKITEGDGLLPKYEVTLSNETTSSFTERTEQTITQKLIQSATTSSGGFASIFNTIGRELFLQKKRADTAQQPITFQQGLKYPKGEIDANGAGTLDKLNVTNEANIGTATSDTFRTSDSFVAGLLGASGALWEDENGVAHLHTDELVVRQTMTILELIIQKAKVVGGMLVVSAASGKITDYYYDDGNVGWMCVMDYEGNGRFQEGDLVRCSRWDKTTNTLHSYWEEVVEVFTGDDFEAIILSQTEGNALPQVGDNLVLMGNVSDTSRQGFITISVDGGTPKIDEYDGVKSKSLVGCLKGRFGDLSGITWQGEELSGYGIWTENLCATGKLVVDGKPISDYIATKTTEALGDAQGANRNLLVGTNQGTANWLGAYSTAPDGSSGHAFWKSEIEYQGQKGVQYDDNGDYADGSWFNMRYPIATSKLVAPKTYIVSADVYLWDGVTETVYLYCSIRREADSGNPLTGQLLLHRKPVSGGWQHVTFVMPLLVAPNTDYNDYNVTFELRDVNGRYRLSNGIRFVNLMCGEGNIPSSWSPSPEDTETKINEVTTTYDSKFEVVNGQLTSLQTKTIELTTAIEDAEGNITDIEKRVTTNESSIEQNANAIALEVTNRTNITDDLGEQISENTALIEQTASEIRSEVSQEITDVNGNIDAMYSQIKQEADSIALVINRDNKLALQLGACNLLLGTASGLVDKWRAVDNQASLKKRQYTASDGTLGVEIYRDAVLSTTPAYEYVGYELLPEKIVGGKIYVVSFDVTLTHSASQSVYPRVCLRGVSNSNLSSFLRASSAITSGTKTHYDIQVYGANSGISGSIYVVGIDFVNSLNTSAGVWGNWTSVKIENMMLQELSADGTIQSYTQAPEDFPNALEETGIFINERQIKLNADNVQVENNDGETTFLLDSDGRLNTNLITAKEIIATDDAGEIVASMNASNDRAYKVYHSNGNPMLVIGKYNVTDKDGVEWIMMISCFDEAGLFLWGIPYGTTGQFSTPTLPYNWSEVKFCDPSLYSLTDTDPTALMKVVQSVTYYKFNSDDTTSANQYAQYNSKVCYSSGVDGLSNPIADGIYWSASIATFANTTNGVVTSYTHTRLGTKYEGGFPVNDGILYRITWKTYLTADGNTELT